MWSFFVQSFLQLNNTSPQRSPGMRSFTPTRVTCRLSCCRSWIRQAGRGLAKELSLTLGSGPAHVVTSWLIHVFHVLPCDRAILLKLFSRTPDFTLSHFESSIKKPHGVLQVMLNTHGQVTVPDTQSMWYQAVVRSWELVHLVLPVNPCYAFCLSWSKALLLIS